jgi:hypothetical protein
VALRERAVYLVSHEGKTRAEAAQAVGVQRKRDRKIIHSLRLIFTTFVLISLSVRRTCTGGILRLTNRRGGPFLYTPSISATKNVGQLIPMAQPDLDAASTRRTDTSLLRGSAAQHHGNTDDPPFSERKPKLQSDTALRLLLGSGLRVRGIFPFGRRSPL